MIELVHIDQYLRLFHYGHNVILTIIWPEKESTSRYMWNSKTNFHEIAQVFQAQGFETDFVRITPEEIREKLHGPPAKPHIRALKKGMREARYYDSHIGTISSS